MAWPSLCNPPPINQAQPLSRRDLLHFCLFDPTGGGVAVQNKHSPADGKYWSLHQAPFVCEGPAVLKYLKPKRCEVSTYLILTDQTPQNRLLVMTVHNEDDDNAPPSSTLLQLYKNNNCKVGL